MPAFRFLLGSRLYDTMGFDDFEAQFSQKYRGEERLRVIYAMITGKRRALRLQVDGNIKDKCGQIATAGAAAEPMEGVDDVTMTIDEAQTLLSKKEAELDAEVEELEEECDGIKADIDSTNALLDGSALQILLDSQMDHDLFRDLEQRLRSSDAG